MSLNILIVDDDAQARHRMRALLSRCGAALCGAVEEAADTTRAAGLMRHRRFDLLLLDIQMPGDNGLALATALRWWPEKPAVVFVTGHPQHALEAFEADALDYLTKPVRPDRLERALAKAVLHRPAMVPAPPSEAESLKIVVRGQARRLPMSEVLYLRAEAKRIRVFTATNSFLIDGALVDLERRHANDVVRVHRHTLAARHALASIRRVDSSGSDVPAWQLRLRGTTTAIAISRRLVSAVRAQMLAPDH